MLPIGFAQPSTASPLADELLRSSTTSVSAQAEAALFIFSGDLILALTRPYIANGLKISRCPETYDGALLNQRVAALRPIEELLNADFAFLFLRSDFVLRGYQAEFESKGQQPNLKSEHITHLRLPLPPPAEQAAIVERVEALMATCRALEAEMEHARFHADHLLQAVLREAFGSASGQPDSAPPVQAADPIPQVSLDAYTTLVQCLRSKGRLASADAQAVTRLDAAGVRPLLHRLVAEGLAKAEGQKRGTRYVLTIPIEGDPS